jgi:poly(3-hydroxybutyrate) depolymerase
MRFTLFFLGLVSASLAATAVKVTFTLNTTDDTGAPVVENRYYYVYRPDGYPLSTPLPMILVMEASAGSAAYGGLNAKAGQMGFVVVSCSFSGNSTGTPGTVWNNDNPRISGWEDMDYTDAVIARVKASDNCNDVFITGLSKGGHMAFAYACERPGQLKAAAPVDEFMGLTSNIASAPLPIIVFQGTADTNVPYTMVRDSVDAWRMTDGVFATSPIITYEASPRLPGKVTQTTWHDGVNGTQVAFVTITGGTHTYATANAETGYNYADGVWAFFSQYLTPAQAAPKIVSPPVNNIQPSGQPASFWVGAAGASPLRFQWQRNGTDIPGATNTWYTTPPTSQADNGATYRAIVTNSAGSATSSVATLTVSAIPTDPVIITPPQSQTVTAGQPLTLTASASGSGTLAYQWLKNGMPIPNATGASLPIASTITPDSGAAFRVVITNAAGTVTSEAATLTVLPASRSPVIITYPARARVRVGTSATFSVNAWSATPMTYQWQKGTGTANQVDIPGATSATYTTPPTALAETLTLFRCIVSNAAGSTTSGNEFLVVSASPTGPTDITSPVAVGAQAGVPFSYTIVSTGGTTPLTFAASPLPPGLALDPVSGVISGSPTTAGTTRVILTAQNSTGQTTATLVITVTADPPVIALEDWRWAHFGISAINPAISGDQADPDGDGVNNRLEYAAGTDPLVTNQIPDNLVGYRGRVGQVFEFTLTGAAGGAVWGTDAYTDDSSLGRAAVHAGAIAAGQTATVTVTILRGQDSYAGSTRNGVSAAASGPWGGSFKFGGSAGGGGAPTVLLQPLSKTVSPGAPFLLAASSSGTGNTYQWMRDGAILPGETNATLQRPAAAATDSGSYVARIANAAGSVLTSAGMVRVTPAASRAANISVRAAVAAGQSIIPGFYVQGTGSKRVLVRAVGPGLGQFNVAGVMANPKLELFRGSVPIAENDDWDGATGTTAAFAAVGAFALSAGSRDAVFVADLAAGQSYTAVASAASGTGGVVLVEVYDADGAGNGSSRLTNVSVRGSAGTSDATLILGFVLGGEGRRTLLVRGVGPALANFGVTAPLADPRLLVFDSSPRLLLLNDNWGQASFVSELVQATANVGAFPLAAGSRDAASVLLLDPGAYTLHVSGTGVGTGDALVEVYDVP